MIVNPSKEKIAVFEGTRLVQNGFGLPGTVLYDPEEASSETRIWRVLAVYAPVKRHIAGIRVKCQDQKGFISFLNQRDLELLLGIGKPGSWCSWLGEEYPEVSSSKFVGFCMDADDIADDLYDRELLIRSQMMEVAGEGCVIPEGTEIEQYLHYSANNDCVRRCLLRWDFDRATGISPDPRLSTLAERWIPYETERITWSRC